MANPIRIAGLGLLAGTALLCVFQLVLVWPFTAEDAWIVNRYAVNLVTRGELTYNAGERVSALTSPPLAFLEALLYVLFGSIRVPYKVLSILLFSGVLAVGVRVLRRTPGAVLLYLCLVAISPVLNLWVVGGLETPILTALVTLAAAMLLASDSNCDLRRSSLVSVICGLAFLVRYDSILFSLPVLVGLLLHHRSARGIAALLAGALAPLGWLIFAASYFGDVLPTSFYAKTPGGGVEEVARNVVSTADFLLFSGILPVLLTIAVAAVFDDRAKECLRRSRRHWGLAAGLLLAVVFYGATSATIHMMFGSRLLVPYLPAAALLLASFFADYASGSAANAGAGPRSTRVATVTVIAAASVFLLQVLNTAVSMGQLAVGRVGELRTMSVREYMRHIDGIDHGTARIAAHWKTTAEGATRPPRIYTYAGGILPFHLKDAYIYEWRLVSYRHRCRPTVGEMVRMADYVHSKVPLRKGLPDERYGEELQLEAIARYDLVDTDPQHTFYVFYNPQPDDNILPPGLHDDCLTPQERTPEPG